MNSITITPKTSDHVSGEILKDTLYMEDIIAAIRKQLFDDDYDIKLSITNFPEEMISTLGMYTVNLIINKEIETKIKVWVIADLKKYIHCSNCSSDDTKELGMIYFPGDADSRKILHECKSCGNVFRPQNI